MSHEEYVRLRAKGQAVGVKSSAVLRLVKELPVRYQAAHTFWSWVWGLSIPAFIVLAFFTSGLGLLGLVFITPLIARATKLSAADFVLEHATENKEFFDRLIAADLLEFKVQ